MISRTIGLAALTAGLFISAAQAAPFINTGFEEGSFAGSGLNDFSSITAPTLTAGAGAGATTGLDFGSDGASASASRTIDAITAFSMMGRYNGNAGTANGTLSFGWTQAAVDFNPFNGTGTGVVATDHVIVGVSRIASNAFQLAAANGVHGAMSGSNVFGTTAASLTNGNWYRLEGTIAYNSTTKVFTFTNVSLDDFGSAGTSQVTADLLSGTGATVTASTFGTTGRAVFLTNRDRGFQITDNYVADAVPEPTALALAGLGAIGLLARRRRA